MGISQINETSLEQSLSFHLPFLEILMQFSDSAVSELVVDGWFGRHAVKVKVTLEKLHMY
jgi:hypothetical protein